jgi:preprotein translocase subunit SecG
MFTAIAILMMIASILLVLAVLAQNSKGGGLAAGFSAGTQIMGVRRTTDIIEKITWGLAISLFVLSVGAAFFLPKNQGATGPASAIQEQIDQSTVPTNQTPPLPTDQNQE